MNGLDAFGKVAEYTTSIALFSAVHSTNLSESKNTGKIISKVKHGGLNKNYCICNLKSYFLINMFPFVPILQEGFPKTLSMN